MRPDIERQKSKAEALAGVFPPYGDPEAHAADIADALRPLIAAELARVRAPRPAPTPHELAMMEACREVGVAIDKYEQAKFANRAISTVALRRLERAARQLRNLMPKNQQTGDRK